MDRFSFASFQLLTTETMKRDDFLFMYVTIYVYSTVNRKYLHYLNICCCTSTNQAICMHTWVFNVAQWCRFCSMRKSLNY